MRLDRFDRIQAVDATSLFRALGGEDHRELWRYIPIGPFPTSDSFISTFRAMAEMKDWVTYAIYVLDNPDAKGIASYMRLRREHGSVEVGCIVFSPALQRTPAATEAMYLMARHIFDDLGYRRYEWKCDNNNEASKRAAARLGFTFEGVFRQDQVIRGENRDTAWFSLLDREWPDAKAAFEAWLAPENFDANGVQRCGLGDFRNSG